MYTQQQAQQTTSSTPDLAPSTQAQDLGSNQAMVEDAGLDSAAGLDLAGLGDMAEFVLDLLPLSAALPVASSALHEPGVQAWLGQQDPEAVVEAMMSVLPSSLLDFWPVGLGVFLDAEVGAALGLGADLEGEIELLRADSGDLQVKVRAKAKAGLAEVGEMLQISGGGDQALLALGATGKLAVQAERTDTALVGLDAALLVAIGNLAGPTALSLLLAGASAVAQRVAGLNLADHVDPGVYEQETRLGVVAEAEAKAAENALDCFPVDMGTLVEQLQPYLDALSFYFDGSYSGECELLSSSEGISVSLRNSLATAGDLGSFPFLAELIDCSLLDTLSQELGGKGLLELRFALQLNGCQVLPDPAVQISLLLEQAVDGFQATDRIDLHLDQLPELVASLGSGQGLSSLLAATGFSRSVQLPAPAEVVDQVVPELATAVTGMMSDSSVLAGSDSLHLEGCLTAGPEVMQLVAGSGITAEAGTRATDALADIHQALCALAGGLDAIPSWLQPWRDTLAQAASSMVLVEPRLVGKVELGLGFEAKGTHGASMGGDAKGSTGFSVDQVLDPATASSVLQALASGAFTLPGDSAAASGSAQGQADSGTTSDTSSNSATGGGAVAASPEHPAL